MNERKQFGDQAEQLVALYLQRQGYTIVARNWRRPFGELDIVALSRENVLFVEVKGRKDAVVDAGEVITHSKQQRIAAAARAFMSELGEVQDKTYRFDVALVDQQNATPAITYIADAFNMDEY